MRLAVNYSEALRDLLRAGRVQVDLIKCPAWPDLIARALAVSPVCVHFPLMATPNGIMDSDARAPADWAGVETLLDQTGTRYVNLHLSPTPADLPGIAIDETGDDAIMRLMEALAPAANEVVERFGADRVLLENGHTASGRFVRGGSAPGFLRQLVAETGCGFLLDVSHARLAAPTFGLSADEYLRLLPLERVRELHLTGIQTMDAGWQTRLRAAGIGEERIERVAGRDMDHLPMTDDDRNFLDRFLASARRGEAGQPDVAAFEVGGVGGIWEVTTGQDDLVEQVPWLWERVHAA